MEQDQIAAAIERTLAQGAAWKAKRKEGPAVETLGRIVIVGPLEVAEVAFPPCR
jgi:hypothetical protein